jgi:hypothetical protein
MRRAAKFFRSRKTFVIAAAAAVFASVGAGRAAAAWLGTTPATGKVVFVGVNDLHDLFYTAVTLSVAIPNCSGSPTAAYIPNKQPNGTPLVSHDNIVRTATSALLSGRRVDVWADTVTYTVFGSPQNVCMIHQITLRND